jgi:hypothetical protein
MCRMPKYSTTQVRVSWNSQASQDPFKEQYRFIRTTLFVYSAYMTYITQTYADPLVRVLLMNHTGLLRAGISALKPLEQEDGGIGG